MGSTRWIQLGSDIDGESLSDYSGSSVSLSNDGSIVAIGAPNNDGNGSNSGQTRVYQWDSTSSSWNQLGSDIDGEAADDYSGFSISCPMMAALSPLVLQITMVMARIRVKRVFTSGINIIFPEST